MDALPSWGLTGAGRRIRSTDNEDVARAYGSDPLFHKSARTDAIYRLVELMAKGAKAPTHLCTLPVLLLYGGNDQIIPRVATEVFSSLMGQNATGEILSRRLSHAVARPCGRRAARGYCGMDRRGRRRPPFGQINSSQRA